jgi:hypothetical protein
MRIIVRQSGGLGNQIFQYAAGVYFANRYGAALTVAADPDPNAASHGSPRPFRLSTFRLGASEVRAANRLEYFLLTTKPAAQPAARLMRGLVGARVFADADAYRFFPELPFSRKPRVVYLRGYWQAAGYAAAVEAQLRQDLTLKDPPTGKNLETLERIASCPCPVSLHIRRGDYLVGDLTLSLLYYQEALRMVRSLHPDAALFVFSDDMEYARAHLPRDLPTCFVDHNDDFSAQEDLRLMAACHHHVIANSSFSWWGAWLNARPGKLVIAPRNWRGDTPSYYPDLYPGGWKAIENPPKS